MRYLSFERGGKATWGAVKGDGAVDLSAHYPTLRDAIAADADATLRAVVDGAKADVPLAGLRYLPPVPAPEKIVCVGVNYANRNEEYKDNSDAPKYPSIFIRTPGTLVGHEQPIIRPPESPQLDYEGEIVLVIGKSGRRIAEDRAWDHIFGVSIMNEGTIRDWLRHSKFNVTQGKNFEASGAWGPWIVTADEIDRTKPIAVETRVNGETRQNDTTESLIFSFNYLVRYISTFVKLNPGDVIATGTPVGAGARFDPPKWLVPGDTVAVTVPGIGTLRNTVKDEPV